MWYGMALEHKHLCWRLKGDVVWNDSVSSGALRPVLTETVALRKQALPDVFWVRVQPLRHLRAVKSAAALWPEMLRTEGEAWPWRRELTQVPSWKWSSNYCPSQSHGCVQHSRPPPPPFYPQRGKREFRFIGGISLMVHLFLWKREVKELCILKNWFYLPFFIFFFFFFFFLSPRNHSKDFSVVLTAEKLCFACVCKCKCPKTMQFKMRVLKQRQC